MVNIRYILFGILLLLLGALVYLTDRPPERTWFVSVLPFQISLYDNTGPLLFGPAGRFLPHLAHVMAFTFLTAGILNCGKRCSAMVTLFWLFVNLAFELGQKYGTLAAGLVPNSMAEVLLLDKTRNYFLRGTYCPLDMAAVGVGALLAYLLLIYGNPKRKKL
ncbi:MAG: hypothetical protein ACLFPD_01870 [Desulfosudaceae bacterium]